MQPYLGDRSPYEGVNFKGELYFAAFTDYLQFGLWKSDGTEAGTKLVKDLEPGRRGDGVYELAVVGDLLYISIDQSIWKSDGTEKGTVLATRLSSYARDMTAVEDSLFFINDDPEHGKELWKSDGTEAGTSLVKDINPGTSSAFQYYHYGIAIDNTFFFVADDGTSGSELWKTDGTITGTVRVKDIQAGSNSSSPGDLRVINNTLFFSAQSNEGGRELWKSDGTAEGTVQVKDIQPGTDSSSPIWLTVMGTKLYFSASDGLNNYELWVSDGTENGTHKVKEINLGSTGSQPYYLAPVGSTLFFVANDGVAGAELWKSDGTEAGTVIVKDIAEGTGSTKFDTLRASDSGILYFAANDGIHGAELWKSDGSSSGTVLVKDILPGVGTGVSLSTSYYTLKLVGVGSQFFFSAYNGVVSGMWRSDGTENGTYRLPIEGIGTNSALDRFSNFIPAGDSVYFSADDGIHGIELWKSDGTDAGTKLVKDINPNEANTYPHFQLIENGILYFSVITNGSNGTRSTALWKSDGSLNGTVTVATLPADTDLFASAMLNHVLYFTTNLNSFSQSTQSVKLWRSDGTTEGTKEVKELCTDSCYFYPYLNVINNHLVFLTFEGAQRTLKLWQSDGTESGTTLLKDFGVPSTYDSYLGLHQVGDVLLFSGYDSEHGVALWKTDGTVGGTALVKDVLPDEIDNPFSIFITRDKNFYVVDDNHLLFWVVDKKRAMSLWKSDGSELGTIKLIDFNTETYIRNVVGIGDTFYFIAIKPNSLGILTSELWKTDGKVTEILAAPQDGLYGPVSLVKVGQTLFFGGYDEEHGVELWTSDGTVAGTRSTYDLFPGVRSSLPNLLIGADNRLYFSAFTPEYGNELWMLDVPPQALQLSSPSSGAPGSSFIFTGNGFNPNEELPVYLTQVVSSASITADPLGTVLTDASGAFTVTLITDSAMAPGNYTLEVGDTVKVSAAFSLDSNAPLQQPASAGTVFVTTQNVYLPLVNR